MAKILLLFCRCITRAMIKRGERVCDLATLSPVRLRSRTRPFDARSYYRAINRYRVTIASTAIYPRDQGQERGVLSDTTFYFTCSNGCYLYAEVTGAGKGQNAGVARLPSPCPTAVRTSKDICNYRRHVCSSKGGSKCTAHHWQRKTLPCVPWNGVHISRCHNRV